MPKEWSFEVIEAKIPAIDNTYFWQDYEFYEGRKNYASDVTGAYYTNRLAAGEYLEEIKKQASVIIIREIGDYWAPLGVGILREVSRNAFKKHPLKFNSLKDAFDNIQTRMKIDVNKVIEKSILLNKKEAQLRLNAF